MKEKLAVVLFATSTQALVFCVFHNKVLGDDYKVSHCLEYLIHLCLFDCMALCVHEIILHISLPLMVLT